MSSSAEDNSQITLQKFAKTYLNDDSNWSLQKRFNWPLNQDTLLNISRTFNKHSRNISDYNWHVRTHKYEGEIYFNIQNLSHKEYKIFYLTKTIVEDP